MFDGKTLSWIHLPSVDSTSRWIESHAPSLPADALTIVYADEQTAGRGQHGRSWVSPPNLNLYTTLFLRLEQDFPFLANIGQTLTMSCVKTFQSMHLQPEVKWPNDLRFTGKKIGGILTQVISIDHASGILLGLGINVNMPMEMLLLIDQPATSLLEESGHEWNIQELLFKIVGSFLIDLKVLRAKGFASIGEELQSVLCFVGKRVLFSDEKGSFEAICQGIDERGRLKLLHPSGAVDTVYTGSIKPL